MSTKKIRQMAHGILETLTIQDVLEAINKHYGEATALQIEEKDGSFRKLSYVGLGRKAVDISSALIKFGLQKGDRVAVFSESRPEWAAVFFAVVSCGGIVVPLDVKLSPAEIAFILNDSGARFVFVSAKLADIMAGCRGSCPSVEKVIGLDGREPPCDAALGDFAHAQGEQKYNPIYPDDEAMIVYTSGTTGTAKGVVLTYRSLLFEVVRLNGYIHFSSRDRFVSILPLNHMLEITGGLIAPLYAGATITYCDSIKPANILGLMQETRATSMVCVPLVLKMFHEAILKKAQKAPPFRRRLFFFFLGLSRWLARFGVRPGRLLFRGVHRAFGGRLRCFISGGAPLDPYVEEDFWAMGFNVLQGYGLTETSPVITVNTFRETKFASVGIPLEGVEVRILPREGVPQGEGEIVVRGPNVMRGYYKQPEKTQEVLRDGWFYTGDIGRLDKDGFLYVTGRIKSMIVLGAGKKVFPEEIEEVMGKSPLIKEICVVGRQATSGLKAGTEEVCAAIVPNEERFMDHERKDASLMKARLKAEIGRLSANLAEYKRISDFIVVSGELPKTTTRKIKRALVKDLIVSGPSET
ncbi:MAG: AMP-dependent synthetase/ligase [Deltaproteobacteria bacterium]